MSRGDGFFGLFEIFFDSSSNTHYLRSSFSVISIGIASLLLFGGAVFVLK